MKTSGDWKTRTSNRYFCIVKVFKAFFLSLDLLFTPSVDIESTGRNASPFFLQKMSGHTLRSSSQKMKANIKGCLLLDAKKKTHFLFLCIRAHTLVLSWRRVFIRFGIVSPLCCDNFLTFVVMIAAQQVTEQSSSFRRLTGTTYGGDLMVPLSFQLVGGMVQRVAGRLQKQGDVPSSMLLVQEK